MPLYNPAFVAGPNSNISPARFVKISGDFTVSQCTAGVSDAGDVVIGVSQEGSLAPPGIAEALGGSQSYYAATPGKTLKVFGLGDICVVTVGPTPSGGQNIAAGDKVKSDSQGRAIKASSGDNCGGIALQGALEGEKLLIQVNPHKV